MRTFACCFLLLAVAMAAAAADVSGKWSGTFAMTGADGQTHESGVVLIFRQHGTELTGTAGYSEAEQVEIANCKFEGDKITGDVHGGHGASYKLDLAVEGEHIKGEVAVALPDGSAAKGKLDVTRVK